MQSKCEVHTAQRSEAVRQKEIAYTGRLEIIPQETKEQSLIFGKEFRKLTGNTPTTWRKAGF